MANNRLYLVCERCGDHLPLARLQVGMQDEWLPARISDADREEWYSAHSYCRDGSGLKVSLLGENDRCLQIMALKQEHG